METKKPQRLKARIVDLPYEVSHPSIEDDLAKSHAANLAKVLAGPPPGSPGLPIKVIRLKNVKERTGLGRSAIYYLMDSSDPRRWDPTFPKSFKISKSAVGWIESEIDGWLNSRVAASRTKGSSH